MLSYWPEVWKKFNFFKKNKKGKSKKKRDISNLIFALKVVVAGTVLFGAYNYLFIGRILPNVFIAGTDVSGLMPENAVAILRNNVSFPTSIKLTSGSDEYDILLDNIGVTYDIQGTVYSAYNLFRTGNPVYDTEARISAAWNKRNVGIQFSFDDDKFNETMSVLAGQIAKDPIYPYIWKDKEGNLIVTKGQNGNAIDLTKMKADVKNAISNLETAPITIQTKTINTELTKAEEDLFLARAKALVGKKLNLTFEYDTFTYTDTDLYALLAPKGGYNDEKISDITAHIASVLKRDPQNPNFVFKENTGRVEEFAPAKPGVAVNEEKLAETIKGLMQNLESISDSKTETGDIAVTLTDPEVSTDTVNDLGIKELIGRGHSTFRGSITSRIYNVNLAATRLNGILIKPDEVFSFNRALGDVSKLTGYKEAYVIKDGKTALGDGGGVCQVSTTLFRATLDAGLPIVERRAHSYRVGYYEQDVGTPGWDATVYDPTTDFKFKNDTGHYILIQTHPDTKNLSLVFELYGTSDGRTATFTKPVITSTTPPPEDLYVDDPTLPAGQIKQIDWKAWGAKSNFKYTVVRDGETIIDKTFYSNYRPWQSIYLRGTGPAI